MKINKIYFSLKLSRPFLDLAVGLSVVLGQFIVLKNLPHFDTIILGFLTGYCIAASSMISNDIYDIEVDKINNPERVLPSNKLSIFEAKLNFVTYLLIGLIASYLMGIIIFFVSAIFAVLGFLYNYKIKEYGIAGNLIVSTSALLPFVLGAFSVGLGTNALAWILGLITFCCNLSGELVGGIMDYKGDRARKVHSVANLVGVPMTLLFANFLLIFAMGISWLPVILNLLKRLYLVYVAFFNIVLAYIIWNYIRYNGETKKLLHLKNMMLYSMMIVLIIVPLDILF